MSPDGIAAFVVIFSRSLELVRKDKELLRLCLGFGGKINDTSVLVMTLVVVLLLFPSVWLRMLYVGKARRVFVYSGRGSASRGLSAVREIKRS